MEDERTGTRISRDVFTGYWFNDFGKRKIDFLQRVTLYYFRDTPAIWLIEEITNSKYIWDVNESTLLNYLFFPLSEESNFLEADD